MDQVSAQYVRMTCGPQSRLHQPTATVNFVEQLQATIERSSAPRKNFLIDATTPHGDAVITEASAMKPSIGWITLQVTEGIRRGVHEWCIKIESQGETTDGSGLMLGILPKNFSKHDSFISQGGGWCLSRAGKFYGHWRRQDANAGTLSFGTGDRVIFILDYDAARMTVRVGDKYIVGEISNLSAEVFPAVSLHYRHQHIRFEYHIVHDRSAKQLDWMERGVFPSAAAYLPLSLSQVQRLPLHSYLFSALFVDRATQLKERGTHRGGGGAAAHRDSSVEGVFSRNKPLEYASLEASSARLTVLLNAFAAVRRYTEVSPAKGRFLAPHVTAEYLRKRFYESMRGGVHSSTNSGAVIGGSYDPTLNCGAVIVMHMFARITGSGSNPMALPLVESLQNYLLSLPLFSLAECGQSGSLASQLNSSVAPEVAQLAVDNIFSLVDTAMEQTTADTLSPLNASLLELATLFALQRGAVHETLRACRYLLRYPHGSISRPLIDWIQRNTSALRPRKELPDIGQALKSICEDTESLTPTGIDPSITILSVAYSSNSLFLHSSEGISQWMRPSSNRFVEVQATKEPANCCPGALRSTMATTLTHLFLLTNRMRDEGIAVVIYTTALEVHRVYRLDEVDITWPREPRANAQILSGPEGQVILVYENYGQPTVHVANGTAALGPSSAVGGAGGSLARAATRGRVEVVVQGFSSSAFPKALWSINLSPNDPGDFTLRTCLALRKPSMVDLGSPDVYLNVAGGHVTVELWVMLLDREDAATLYQHGDKSTSGEVFLETARLEGAFSIRGGYRHDARGSCVVSAPLPPTAETRFLHIALVFDGRWHLFLDGEEVAGNRQGPHVSLNAPKQRWTVGTNCTCLLAGLRVWLLGRSAREVGRDYKRYLTGDEPGLCTQLFFNESSGNVVFNYVTCPKARHAICVGAFSRVNCESHPWNSMSNYTTPESVPRRSEIHEWKDLTLTRCFATAGQLTLVTQVSDAAPFSLTSGRVFSFFDLKTGVAYPALFYLTSKSTSRGFIGSDDSDNIWELFELEQDSSSGAGASGPKVVYAASLPLESSSYGETLSALELSPVEISPPETVGASRSTASAVGGASMSSLPEQTATNPFLLGHPPSPDRATTPQKLTYHTLAVWLLQLLSMYASEEPTQGVSQLFSPLADDVGRRCLAEVKNALQEHFRVVKGPNARRAAVLKSGVSTNVVACALRILLRLIRRVRVFGLYPASVGLNVIGVDPSAEELSALLKELCATSSRRRGSASASCSQTISSTDMSLFFQKATDGGAVKGSTLLGALGDVINEAGTTLPRSLGVLAHTAVMEGIDLFIPSVRCRAKMLQELLSMHAALPAGSPRKSGKSANAECVERVPALESLLASTIRSLSTVLSASPLMYPQTDATVDGGHHANVLKLDDPSTQALDDTRETLRLLIAESVYHLRSHFAAQANKASSDRSPSAASALAALPDAIGALQLLLLSNCQGIPVDQLLSNASSVAAPTGIFARPRTAQHSACTREYYTQLFSAAGEGLSLVIRHTMSIKEDLTASSDGKSAGACGGIDRATWHQLRHSFLGSPLHAAITAIPLIVSVEDATWFLRQLEALLPLCESLRHRLRLSSASSFQTISSMDLSGGNGGGGGGANGGGAAPASPLTVGRRMEHSGSPCAALYDATLLSASWVATCMVNAKATLTTFPHTDDKDTIDGSISNSKAAAASGDIHPDVLALSQRALLSGGIDLSLMTAVAAREATKSSRRSLLLQRLQKDGARWIKLHSENDPLATKVPNDILSVVTVMAVTALYLSNEALPSDVQQSLLKVMQRLTPARNELLQRRSQDKKGFAPLLADIERRCDMLLCTTCALEVSALEDVLYRPREFSLAPCDTQADVFRSTMSGQESLVLHSPGFPQSPRDRWLWARRQIRQCRRAHMADTLSNPALGLTEAIALVSSVAISQTLTASAIQASCREHEKLASLRLQGLEQLLRLMRREPSSTESVALLLGSNPGGLGSNHYEDGLSGCASHSIGKVRSTLYDVLGWFRDYQSNPPRTRGASSDDDIMRSGDFLCVVNSPVLCEVMQRSWAPRDFAFFYQLRIVSSVFSQYCTIFASNSKGTDEDPLSAVKLELKGESASENRHREEAVEFGKRKMSGRGATDGAAPLTASEEEDREATVLRTRSEYTRKVALNCLKTVGLQCATMFSQTLSCLETAACSRFLENLINVVSDELSGITLLLVGEKPLEPLPEAAYEQVHLLASLVCAVMQALPPTLRFETQLSVAAATLASTVFQLSLHEMQAKASGAEWGGAAKKDEWPLVRLCSLLLQHSNPAAANAAFNVSIIREVSDDALGYDFKCPAITAMAAYIVTSLSVTGLREQSQHGMVALRQLLQRPHWAAQLAELSGCFASTLRQCGVETSWTRERTMNAFAVYTWSVALGGALLVLPSPGMHVLFYDEESRCTKEGFVVDYSPVSETVTVVPTQWSETGLTEEKWLSQAHAGCQNPPQETGMLQDVEKQVSHDHVFLPPLKGSVELPPFEGLVDAFIAPAIQHFLCDIPDSSLGTFTSVEIAALTSFLHIALSLVRQSPRDCAGLIEGKSILAISRFARRSIVQMPLPVVYLKEYAAHAMRVSFQLTAASLTDGTQSPVASRHSSPLGPDFKRALGPGPLMSVAPRSHASFNSNSSNRAQAPLESGSPHRMMRQSSSAAVSLSPLATLIHGTGASREASRLLSASMDMPSDTQRKDQGPSEGTSATPTVCLFAGPHGEATSCIDITPVASTQTPGSKAAKQHFPTWSDGVSVEVSLMLCDRVFPDLGEDYAVPSTTTWDFPDIQFTLFTLHAACEAPASTSTGAKPTSTFPVITVGIKAGALVCTVRPFASSGDNLVECKIGLTPEDWDRFLHIGVVLDEHQVLLTKAGESVVVPLSPTVAGQLASVLSSGGRVKRLVLGATDPSSITTAQPPEDASMIFFSGLRMWGSSVLKNSVSYVAEMVSRDQALSILEPLNDNLFFQFFELAGDTACSHDANYAGKLKGAARWAPCPFHVSPIVLDCSAKLNTGCPDDSVMMFPRSEVQHVFGAMDTKGVMRVSNQVLWSLVARLSRIVTVEAMRTSLSPDYEMLKVQELASQESLRLSLPTSPAGRLFFNPFHIVEPGGLALQLGNLFRCSDVGHVDAADAELLEKFVGYVLRCFVVQKQSGNIQELLEETSAVMLDMLRESTETFHIEVSTHGTASKGASLLPLTLINGGKGTLSFAAKNRQLEQVTIYKDRAQKNVLMKYPDGQGGWPDCPIAADQFWFYTRIFGQARPPALVIGTPTTTLQITVKSMQPVVMRYVFNAVADAFRSRQPLLEPGMAAFLNTYTIASLVQVGSAGARGDACTHAVDILTTLLQLWENNAGTRTYDQCPLHVALAHLNMPLVAVLQRGKSTPDATTELSPTLGTFSAYTRSLFGLLTSAIRLDCRWRNQPYEHRVQQRWKRLKKLWEDSARLLMPDPPRRPSTAMDSDPMASSDTGLLAGGKRRQRRSSSAALSPSASSVTDLRTRKSEQSGGLGVVPSPRPCMADYTKPAVGMVVLHPPVINPPVATTHAKGNGEWYLRCDRGLMTARSTIGFTKGRLYFEVRVPEASSSLTIGVVTNQTHVHEAGDAIGQDAASWGFDSSRLCRLHKGYRSDFSTRTKWKAGDVLGVLINLEQSRLTCVHNDRQISSFDNFGGGPPSTSRDATLYFPAVSFGNSGCEVNFGASPFAYSLPLGYIPVDPKHYCSPQTARLWLMMASSEWVPSPASEAVQHKRRSSTAGEPHRGLSRMFECIRAYCEGRCGPLTVDLLCATSKVKIGLNDARADDVPCVVRGGVSVSKGKWYYEVMVRGDSGISAGWTVADVDADWGRGGKSLGDDEYSWAIESKRMIARHNKHQTSLGRHIWREGDVIGCLLDCTSGTISYTINGTLQREVHDSDGDGILFRHVDCGGAGLSPAVGMECKTAVTFMWNREELLYLPEGYKPIGAASVVTDATIQYFLSDAPPAVPKKSACGGITMPGMERVVNAISRSVDLDPFHLSAYCLYSLTGAKTSKSSSAPGIASSLSLTEEQLSDYVHMLLAVTSTADILFPVAQVGSIPFDVDWRTQEMPNSLVGTYRSLRRYALPYLGLRALRRFLLATNGSGEGLKLSVNRRKALSTVRDPSASVGAKLSGSLFGQISSLLAYKAPPMFCTQRKLWSVTFFGEGADDVGGPYRESLSQICSELMSTDLPLFIPSPNQSAEVGDCRETYVLNPRLAPPASLIMYRFIGRLLGGCLRSAEPLSLYLPSTLWKELVGEPSDTSDLSRIDLSTVNALEYVEQVLHPMGDAKMKDIKKRNEVLGEINEELTGLCPDGFTIQDDSGRLCTLVHDGQRIEVNYATARDYVQLARGLKLRGAAAPQMEALREGFHQVVPLCAVSSLKWFELEELICGQRDFDPDALLDGAKYDQIDPEDTRIVYLRQVLREFSRRQRALFMRFVSGRERLPTGMSLRIFADVALPSTAAVTGTQQPLAPTPPPDSEQRQQQQSSSAIRGALVTNSNNNTQQRQRGGPTPQPASRQPAPSPIRRRQSATNASEVFNDERLPHASTCFYWLSLPCYSSVKVMREKLLYAIEQCMDIDADFRVHDNDVEQQLDEPTLARVTAEDDVDMEDFSHLV